MVSKAVAGMFISHKDESSVGGEAAGSPNFMSYVQGTHLVYQGPLGLIVCQQGSFLVSRDGFPVGTYSTLEEAKAALEWKARVKAK